MTLYKIEAYAQDNRRYTYYVTATTSTNAETAVRDHHTTESLSPVVYVNATTLADSATSEPEKLLQTI